VIKNKIKIYIYIFEIKLSGFTNWLNYILTPFEEFSENIGEKSTDRRGRYISV